ncbi:hypothetical protein HanHA300_Chr07g0235401 [Helianthus annuus]|nr:hypothetical protein HanHA300_Chr07g0235401 [Helianthus annuus]KAJ0556007.1 hypothetical protein HanIR_Chr07g0308781 [Helianthus annuus]KAJ0562533.1 hypothetical protein HanHA89_Chr07g0252591 [Helianthus annuus]KAJ0727909.1 hypothetical protein HanLR1_Chr07g0235361 [Helianthus annuus]
MLLIHSHSVNNLFLFLSGFHTILEVVIFVRVCNFFLAHRLVCHLDFDVDMNFKTRIIGWKERKAFNNIMYIMSFLQITEKLGSNVPVITNYSRRVIGRDAISDEFKEVYLFYNHRSFLFYSFSRFYC